MSTFFSASGLTAAELAAWTQSVASVLAIGVGAGAIWWQVRSAAQLQHKRDREADVRRLQTIWTLAYHCRVELQNICESTNPWPREHGRLSQKINAMSTMPVFEIPAMAATIAVLTMIDAYRTLDGAATFRNSAIPDAIFRNQQRAHTEAALENFRFGEIQLRRTLWSVGSDIPVTEYRINGALYAPLDAE